MSIVPLAMHTVRAYMGGGRFNSCQDISSIHVEHDIDQGKAKVMACIPGSTTRQESYEIRISVLSDGSAIDTAFCTCPIALKCKHINKVICRIADSFQNPIPGPSPAYLARQAERERLNGLMQRGASVYLAIACKSELDSGSDFRRSMFVKDNFDQQILGVFFSKREANRCAKEFLDINDDDEEEDEDDDMDDDDDNNSDDEDTFVYDGSDEGDYDYENAFQKVWVECRAIEDASPQFHK